MKRCEVDRKRVTPMMLQYLEIKDANPDVIIFFRLGDFYEMFFEDAELVSRELELTLTGKNAGLDERIPMCGIPHHASNVYVEKLTEKGYKVGICEQIEDPSQVKGIVKRDLMQIVSRGTIVQTDALNEHDFNYIGSLMDFGHCFCLCYGDISTGVFYVQMLEHQATVVVSEIVSLDIRELIVMSQMDSSVVSLLQNQFHISISILDEIDEYDEYRRIYDHITDLRMVEAIRYLLTYIMRTQKRSLAHLQPVQIRKNQDYLKMDIHTKRNLELTETLRLKQRNYSLIWLLDRTKTAMGSRGLKHFIENPLVCEEEILKRYDMVDVLM